MFDVAIIDYDMGAVTGTEITSYIEGVSNDAIPVVIVSQSTRKSSPYWPQTVSKFVHKSVGPYAVFDAAFEAYGVRKVCD